MLRPRTTTTYPSRIAPRCARAGEPARIATPAGVRRPGDGRGGSPVHHTSYWDAYLGDGSTCVKTEYAGRTKSLDVPAGASLVVIKAGKVVDIHDSYGTVCTAKDISFVTVHDGDGGNPPS